MFFKNLTFYSAEFDPYLSAMEDNVLANRLYNLKALEPTETFAAGWAPVDSEGRMLIRNGGHILIRAVISKKSVPASVLREETDKRCKEAEAQQGYWPGRTQRAEIKEQVELELLPRAFEKKTSILVWLDLERRIVMLDTSSWSNAETILMMLRDQLGVHNFGLPNPNKTPAGWMTSRLSMMEDADDGFSIDDACILESEDSGVVRYKNYSLDNQDVDEHIHAGGMLVTALSMTFEDRISFTLTDEMQLKKLRFLDVLQDQSHASQELGRSQVEADFTIMTAEMGNLLDALVTEMGGWVAG